jgi:hypothetical protein
MKKVDPETSPTACTWPVDPIYMMKNVGPETSPKACTWPVQPIYMIKVGPETSLTACTITCTSYTHEEEIGSRDFPYSMYMA